MTDMQESIQFFKLNHDLSVFIRLFRPSDINQILIGFEKLSERSRYKRFLNPVRKLPEKSMVELLSVDNVSNMAVCAGVIGTGGWEGAGIARFSRAPDEPGTAEVGLTVIDKYQGNGIGSLLFDTLIQNARDRGIRYLSGSLLTDNTSMIRILRHHSIQSRLEEGPSIRFTMAIDRVMPTGPIGSFRLNKGTDLWFEGMR